MEEQAQPENVSLHEKKSPKIWKPKSSIRKNNSARTKRAFLFRVWEELERHCTIVQPEIKKQAEMDVDWKQLYTDNLEHQFQWGKQMQRCCSLVLWSPSNFLKQCSYGLKELEMQEFACVSHPSQLKNYCENCIL